MRPGIQKQEAKGPPPRMFAVKLTVVTAQAIVQVWTGHFPGHPNPETQLFMPAESLHQSAEDQDTMLHAVAELSPYTARTVIEEAIFPPSDPALPPRQAEVLRKISIL